MGLRSVLASITVGNGKHVYHATRTGDGFARADISTEKVTYRFEVTEEGVRVSMIEKRARSATASPAEEWVPLYVRHVSPVKMGTS